MVQLKKNELDTNYQFYGSAGGPTNLTKCPSDRARRDLSGE
ncbi:unnamed protein product, partial [Rotaria magnacalcarata]